MTAQTDAGLDESTVAALSARFAEVFQRQRADPELFARDTLFDLNVPVWRFQLQGPDAFTAQLQHVVEGEVRIAVLQTVPTATGFVTEHEEHQVVHGEALTARRLWLCRVRDGRITVVTGYCSGEWDAALRARHAAEAPMIQEATRD